MNENNEVRLIDANKIKPVHVEYYGKVVDWATIEYAPTIDPENVPIVRQLREELARVTAERDAAVKDLEQAITIYRDVEGWDILCRFCNGKSCRSVEECKPEWCGPQKEE